MAATPHGIHRLVCDLLLRWYLQSLVGKLVNAGEPLGSRNEGGGSVSVGRISAKFNDLPLLHGLRCKKGGVLSVKCFTVLMPNNY